MRGVKSKLVLLDVVLVALAIVLGQHVRDRWLEARKREAAVFGQPLKQLPPPPYSALAHVKPVTAAEYNDVAQQMLFSPDRNPTVVVEVAPPPPMPKLPVFYGLIDLGGGPFAIMSAKSGDEHKEVRFGEKIGEFKLVSVGREQITLEWRGEKVVRKIEELVERIAEAQPAQAPPPAAPTQAPATTTLSPEKKTVLGVDVGAGHRACQPGDTTAAGSVVEGYRKVERDSPFGKMCQWEQVK